MNEHVAIFSPEAIKQIFKGKKVIDARFSIKRIAPFQLIHAGDIVYMKKSGGKIVGQFRVSAVISFERLTEELLQKIQKDYHRELQVNKYFWSDHSEAQYGTLIFISEVQPVLFPIEIVKRDRRPWMVLDSRSRQTGVDSLR